ncbi:MAG: hypothetical protein IPM13_08170 [Phycisphaerales bacterium]|nr:hypothetical protein [Phycisphaerales bacterium]
MRRISEIIIGIAAGALCAFVLVLTLHWWGAGLDDGAITWVVAGGLVSSAVTSAAIALMRAAPAASAMDRAIELLLALVPKELAPVMAPMILAYVAIGKYLSGVQNDWTKAVIWALTLLFAAIYLLFWWRYTNVLGSFGRNAGLTLAESARVFQGACWRFAVHLWASHKAGRPARTIAGVQPSTLRTALHRLHGNQLPPDCESCDVVPRGKPQSLDEIASELELPAKTIDKLIKWVTRTQS